VRGRRPGGGRALRGLPVVPGGRAVGRRPRAPGGPGRPLAPILALAVGALTVLALAPGCPAQDGERIRGYLSLRLGSHVLPDTGFRPGIDASSPNPAIGASVGVDLTPHLGAEIAADGWSTDLHAPGRGKIGESGMWTIIPQVRLRYPLREGRVVPYAVGGLGVSFSEFKDRTGSGARLEIHGQDTALAGSVGLGVDYLVAGNVAVGIEAKYIRPGSHVFAVDGRRGAATVDSILTTAGLRLLFPESREAPAWKAPAVPELDAPRPYLGFRLGLQWFLEPETIPGIRATSPNDPAYGVSIGVDVARHLGLELAADTWEPSLRLASGKKVAEYRTWTFIPQARVRYPTLDGRLTPYLVGGVGLAVTQQDDRTGAEGLVVRGEDAGVAAALGGGVEYALASNIALGLETRYVWPGSHRLAVGAQQGRAHLDSVIAGASLRVFFPGLWPARRP
jgi:opacity protein-like surface antigen